MSFDNVVRLAEVNAGIHLRDSTGPEFGRWEFTLQILSPKLLHLLQWISRIQHGTPGVR